MRLPDIVQSIKAAPVFVARRESRSGVTYFGENIQIDDAPVVETPEGAPDPIRYSQFSYTGRSPAEQWPTVPVSLHLNIKGIQSVMEDTFLTGKVRVGRTVLLTNGNGGQTAWTERQNIDRGQAAPYGNRVQVSGSGKALGYSNGVPVDAYGLVYNDRRGY